MNGSSIYNSNPNSGFLSTWVQRVNEGRSHEALALIRAERLRNKRMSAFDPSPQRNKTRILFFTHYFPPEGNAPASRVYEMCKRWARAGYDVTVVTCAPNHPLGVLYRGYRNRLVQRRMVDGIRVIRVWTYLAANKGKRRRALNFLSYMASATVAGALVCRRPHVLIATSPQFFCGWAGVLVSFVRRIPLILEIRDIWPESAHAVGAMAKSSVLRWLEWLELRMYRCAYRIVTVGEGYKEQLIRRGVDAAKIDIVTNGVDRDLFNARTSGDSIRQRYRLGKRFVVAYVGTIGMASGLDVVLRAARILRAKGRDDIALLMVGEGSNRAQLQRSARAESLKNVIFTGRLDKSLMPEALAAANACLVHLRKQALFESVLPSKIFEAAGMKKPIILGVKGHAAALIKRAGAGLCVEPENENQIVAAIEQLAADPELCQRFGESGCAYIRAHFDRDKLSGDYLRIMNDVIARSRSAEPRRPDPRPIDSHPNHSHANDSRPTNTPAVTTGAAS
ncbi:glycosyltransferase family 4 protein [soil metagenome]